MTDAEPGARLTLVGEAGDDLLTLSADERGQVVFAYVPAEHMTLETGGGVPPTVNGERSSRAPTRCATTATAPPAIRSGCRHATTTRTRRSTTARR
ncbi:MAG: hypothetical protein R2690_04125 [Acidimicrobiales bacterium]